MAGDQDLDISRDFFSAKKSGNTLLIHFQNHMLFRVTDLQAKDTLLNYLDRVSKNDSIKVVVFVSSPDKRGSQEYIEFFKYQLRSSGDLQAIHRMCNVIDQFILKIVGLDKIVVHATSGRVISMFLNASLACDYRIVADNTVFQNPYLELGIVPKGGGAFFLSKKFGRSKAYEILLFRKEITAHEALKLGIVDRVVTFENLESETLKIAHQFCERPSSTLSGTKRLLNFPIKDLKEYLEFENQEFLRIVEPTFWK